MEITLTFQLTTLLIGTILGVFIGIILRFFLWDKKNKIPSTQLMIYPKEEDRILLPAPKNKLLRRPKYVNSKLKVVDKDRILKQLLAYIEQEKIYRKPNLTLKTLSTHLNVSKNHLSQTINERMECSFLDFINRYRVQEAKKKLQSANLQDYTVTEIGREVGFNSKSTFYAAFKKYTHKTPGDFRRNLIEKC